MRYEMLIDHIKRCGAEMNLETLALSYCAILSLSLSRSISPSNSSTIYTFYRLFLYRSLALVAWFSDAQPSKRHLNHNKAFRFTAAEKQLDVHVLAIA